MDLIKVVCGIVFEKDKVFLCRRKPDKILGGFWEFPGGKLEDNETPIQSLQRELFEELGMKVDVIRHFETNIHQYDGFKVELIAFICLFQEANFLLSDHDCYEWISKNEVLNRKLAPADIPIAKKIVEIILPIVV